MESDLDHWVLKLLKPGFRHCMAIKKSRGGQYWCVVNPRATHIEVELEPVDLYPEPSDYFMEGATIVKYVQDKYEEGKSVHQLSILSCVCVLKGVLGIKDLLCVTPHQLYKRVKDHGYGINGR